MESLQSILSITLYLSPSVGIVAATAWPSLEKQSLERTGVKPDEMLLPTAADVAAKRDPVLARAAALVGLTLDPEKAGALFPLEWRK